MSLAKSATYWSHVAVITSNDKTTNPKKLDSATDKTVETREATTGEAQCTYRAWSSWRSGLCAPQGGPAVTGPTS